MTDTSHLVALETRLAHERARQALAITPAEKEARAVLVAQIEREIEGERAYLGLAVVAYLPPMSDDELLAELAAP